MCCCADRACGRPSGSSMMLIDWQVLQNHCDSMMQLDQLAAFA